MSHFTGYVVDDENTMRSSVVAWGQRSELFLSCSVPLNNTSAYAPIRQANHISQMTHPGGDNKNCLMGNEWNAEKTYHL